MTIRIRTTQLDSYHIALQMFLQKLAVHTRTASFVQCSSLRSGAGGSSLRSGAGGSSLRSGAGGSSLHSGAGGAMTLRPSLM